MVFRPSDNGFLMIILVQPMWISIRVNTVDGKSRFVKQVLDYHDLTDRADPQWAVGCKEGYLCAGLL